MPRNCGNMVSPLKYGVWSLIVGIFGLGFGCLGYLWVPLAMLDWANRGGNAPGPGPWEPWKGWLLLVIWSGWLLCGPLAVWLGVRANRVGADTRAATWGIIAGVFAIVGLICWWVLALMFMIGFA